MNDDYKELKTRMRKLDDVLARDGAADVQFAQALSRLHRAARRGDRSREPSPELRTLLERAEGLAPKVS
jgi:IS4 transposase